MGIMPTLCPAVKVYCVDAHLSEKSSSFHRNINVMHIVIFLESSQYACSV